MKVSAVHGSTWERSNDFYCDLAIVILLQIFCYWRSQKDDGDRDVNNNNNIAIINQNNKLFN